MPDNLPVRTGLKPNLWAVDLWEDEAVNPSPPVDIEALYESIFNRPKRAIELPMIRELIAPLPHRIRNSLMKDFYTDEKREGRDNALLLVSKRLQQMLLVWKSYPFYKLPYLQPVGGDENDEEEIKPAIRFKAPRKLMPASDVSFVSIIMGIDRDDKHYNDEVEQDIHPPFLGYELLRQRKSKRMTAVANRIAYNVMQVALEAKEKTGEDRRFTAYFAAATLCEQWDIIPPYLAAVKRDHVLAAAECGLLRMTCPKWWGKQLNRMRDLCCEHMNVAAGLVSDSRPYVSEETLQEFIQQQKSAMKWLEDTMIENDEGVVLPLVEAAMAGNANPSNRLVELVVRRRGVEEMAKDAGMIGFMITITCPSKYHANSYKWNMTNYKVAQEYLVKQFAKLRSALDYRGINIPGIRVAEPHKDGTPHWHMCTFIQPEHEETFKNW
ncbi:replication endonuclease [Shewanella sp. MTB7]|uniref:replication endonuclease n=2 Tax=unclassified Shewanella TaxID=196818 RepID=UPI0022BA4AF4|nr:replication endonuclease [Shewanella sp. MTB7]WBJ95715.1 replication endonuclease [Shewanella sp. MTB7]